jgi:hypothetical protein
MDDTLHYFFFSYARADQDPYLDRFFVNLKEKVESLVEIPQGHSAAFRDEQNIDAGDDWNTRISAALQNSKVLVCIYSPRFFSKQRLHEYCAKEFAGFLDLERNDDIRYVPEPDDEGRIGYQVRGFRNIVPVLWVSEEDLVEKPNQLPPHVVRSIHYTLNGVGKDYANKGMRSISIRRNQTYDKIITRFARVIIKSSLTPLRSRRPPRQFNELWNAFWDHPIGLPPMDGASQAPINKGTDDKMAVSTSGPGQVSAIEIRPSPDTAAEWRPFKGGPTLAAALGEIASERPIVFSHLALDPAAQDFGPKALSVLKDATARQATPILFVDPACLRTEPQRSAVGNLLRQQMARGPHHTR